MAATKEFHGKPLISSIDGKKLGEIKDVYLDQDATKIVAVYLGKSGIINRKWVYVQGPLAETRSIARGAMTSLGNDGGPMIAAMEQAEKLKLSSA